jgi:hypothetical protein
MSPINDSDLLLVERGGSLYKVTHDRLPELNATDLLLVERGGTLYKCEFGSNGSIADSDLLLVERSGTNYKIAKSGLVFFQGPIGFIDLMATSNLPSNADFTPDDYFGVGYTPVTAVTKGGIDYVVAHPNARIGNYNMYVCNATQYPDLNHWTGAGGVSSYSNVVRSYYPNNSGIMYPAYQQMGMETTSLVYSKPFNALTLWLADYRSGGDRGVYRDYVSSPGEAPNADFWRPVSGNFDAFYYININPGIPHDQYQFNHRNRMLGYASSATSTVVIPETLHGVATDYYYNTYMPPAEVSYVLRTTNGYDYYLNSTTTMFPNQGIGLHYGYEDMYDWERVYWYPSDIAYGNGVYVMTRINWGASYSYNSQLDTGDGRMGMIVSTDDGVSFTNSCKFNGSNYGPQTGFIAVAFNDDDGIFLASENHNGSTRMWTSSDGINWTSITPNTANAARGEGLTYGNGIFVTHRQYTTYYSKNNGSTWYSISNHPGTNTSTTYNVMKHPRYMDQISSFIGSTEDNDLLRFYRFE